MASLCMRRCGLQAAPVYSMFNCIQHLKHHIRTVYGTSSRWFGGDQLETIPHGVGQGNGAAPAIWAVVSTPILNMLRDAGFGVKLQSSLIRSTTHFVAYVFVDDSDQCQTAEHCDVGTSDLLAKMQASLNMWEGGLRASGGALVPEKSHWYLIKFLWNTDGQFRYANNSEEPASLSVRAPNGIVQELERLDPKEARRTLGVRLALDGNNNAELEFRKNQAQEWADALRTGRLPRPLAWLSMTTTILRSLQYPLPATTFSRRE